MSDDDKPARLLDDVAQRAVKAILGDPALSATDLSAMIRRNRELIVSGDAVAMADGLARQAITLETAMNGLLVAMTRATTPEARLHLARAATLLHGACIKALSAVHTVKRDARPAPAPVPAISHSDESEHE